MEKKKLAMKLYYQNNKEKRKEYSKIYRENNKEKTLQYGRDHYENNKEQYLEYNKNYRENNKEYFDEYREINEDKIIETNKNYREKNKDKIKETKQTYNKNNSDKIRVYKNNYVKNKIANDPLFKLKHYIQNRIRDSINKAGLKKLSRTEQILGCSYEDFKEYIESKFESWMTWDNRGNWNGIPTELNTAWDIDHIIPTSSATNEIELLKLNHYTNLQPLCSYTNRNIKKDKY